MKGAGKDCTALFDKYHPWVNFDSLVGVRKDRTSSTVACPPSLFGLHFRGLCYVRVLSTDNKIPKVIFCCIFLPSFDPTWEGVTEPPF